MKFSFTEQVDMILVYGEAQQNSIRAQALYAERYPDRSHPSHRMFQRLCQKLRETGSLTTRTSKRQKRVRHENNETDVLSIVYANPHISSRQIERELDISQRSVLRILAQHKFHPYHMHLHQELHGTDFENRVRFCQWMQHQMHINNEFFSLILFIDEASVTNFGQVNLHNIVSNMKQRIIEACATISPEELRNVCASGIRRLQCCIDANGHHFEHLL